MSREEINVFKLGKPSSFYELLTHTEFIVNDIEKWFNKLKETISLAQQQKQTTSENGINIVLLNMAQKITRLCNLIQKKIEGN